MRSLNREELIQWLKENKQPTYRASQIHDWIWKKHVIHFNQMTNLPSSIRQMLEEAFEIRTVKIEKTIQSSDGTIKSAIRLFDGKTVETVLIPTPTRITACISSQAGCSLECRFCATARLKLMRNLETDEIYDQVLLSAQLAKEFYGRPLTNVVFMGMGEPLLNYKNVIQAIELLSSPDGLGMSHKRFTLSTAGIIKMILKLADDKIPCKLAVSLHAALDDKRTQLMPINQSNSLKALRKALMYYYQKTGRTITLEYLMLDEINDREEDAKALVKFARAFPSKVNLIEFNTVEGMPFKKSKSKQVKFFQQFLISQGLIATIRKSRGLDIDAACGQLAGKLLSETWVKKQSVF